MKKAIYITEVLDILKEQSSKQNPMFAIEIAKIIVERNKGSIKKVDYRVVKEKIELLKSLNFDIRHIKGGYYLEKRTLDKYETKLICDQVLFSSILPKSRKTKIVESLICDFSDADKLYFRSQVDASYKTTRKAENTFKDTIANVEKIMTAVDRDKKISFKYGNYNELKELVLRDKVYKASPYDFIYEEGKYYIVLMLTDDEDENITKRFRIDLMREISISNAKRIPSPIDEPLINYCNELVYMFGEEKEPIELEVTKVGLRGIFDKIGLSENIKIKRTVDDTYIVKFKGSCTGAKYFVLQYTDNVKVLKPASLRDSVIRSLKDSINKYKD